MPPKKNAEAPAPTASKRKTAPKLVSRYLDIRRVDNGFMLVIDGPVRSRDLVAYTHDEVKAHVDNWLTTPTA